MELNEEETLPKTMLRIDRVCSSGKPSQWWSRCFQGFSALLGRSSRRRFARWWRTRILVIDDDAELRATLDQTLKSTGYDVLLAANAQAGLDLYRRQPADLVITDIFMPEKEGLETIIELRREFPEVAIIAMTGQPTASALLSAARGLGAVQTIAKPFQPEELLRVVEEVLARRA